MGRGKIDIRRIESSSSRKVTFAKRRVGLVKKAQELSILCDAEVGLIVFSPAGKLFEFASTSMLEVVDRYMKFTKERQILDHHEKDNHDPWHQEIRCLMKQVETLQSTCKHMKGEDIMNLNLKDLHQLEQQICIGLSHIKARKDHLLLEEIEALKHKEKQLHVETKGLNDKIMEIHKLLEMATSQPKNTTIPPFLIQPHQPNLRDSQKSPITSLQLGLFKA